MRIAEPVQPAVIEWRDGAPFAPAFDDVYFSAEDGPAETWHVFLEGNDLPRRFAAADRFVIGETGFGTGLNFLCAYRLWRQIARPGARLTYFSIEKHPLMRDDLRRAQANWLEFGEEAAALQAAYPAAIPGFHLRRLPGGIDLILAYGEAADMLAEFRGACDAWFLDGFAPAKNDAMWRPDVLRPIAERTVRGGTLATFSAAGAVRRGLEAFGFEVERRSGFGAKRHMTVARRPGNAPSRFFPKEALVIGAGIAGAAAARALAERGVSVTVLEKSAAPAAGASGNPGAILFPLMHRQWDVATRFYLGAYLHLLARLDGAAEASLTGLLQLPKKQYGRRDGEGLAALPARLGVPAEVAIAVSAAQASALAGIAVPFPGIHFSGGGHVRLGALAAAWLDHPAIAFRGVAPVSRLDETAGQWQVTTPQGIIMTKCVVFATAFGGEAGVADAIMPVPGAISLLEAAKPALAQAVGFGGYLLPREGGYALGATYERDEGASDTHAANFGKLTDALPDAGEALGFTPAERWAEWRGVRAVTRDRLPLVGALEEGRFATLGHASRGAVSALLAGEIVAAMACGDPLPVEASVATLLDPERFGMVRPKSGG